MIDDRTRKAYEIMLTGRLMDEFVGELVAKGRRVSHYHSGIGQEALSVGAVFDLHKDDYLFYTHRGVASLLAKGLSLRDVMFDLFMKDGGKEGGTNRGFGSKMHAYAPELGIVGRNGVFGTRFTISAGLALSSKLRKNNKVTVCMYGEAEGARAQYFEAINMAVLWNLPVVFIAENNGFSIDSRTSDLYAPGKMSDMWRGFSIPIEHFDGNNLEEVRSTVGEAVARARAGQGPSVLEGFTYRVTPHSPLEANHLLYRTEEEIERWRSKDPIKKVREKLLADGLLTNNEDKLLREKISSCVQKIYREVEAAPIPPVQDVYSLVYFEAKE